MWTLRGAEADLGTILVVTQHTHRLAELSTHLSSLGYYTFAALPEAVAGLVAVTQFDLVVVTSDVAATERERLAQLKPPLEPKLLTLDVVDEPFVGDRIRARLER